MTIEGTVTYLDFEGGFWGILGKDGAKYRPVDALPASVRSDGCKIVAEVEPANVMSITMWGQTVRVIKIKPA